MDGFLNLSQPHPLRNRKTHLSNHLTSIFTDDRRGDDFVGSLFAVNLAETSVLALGLSSIVVFDR